MGTADVGEALAGTSSRAAPALTAVVLAAGAGSRFGGGKLLARFGGRAVLQHVLDRLAEAGITDPVVVLAPGFDAAAIAWRGARRVVNPEPERGLSSSLQLGFAAVMAADPPPGAALVLLGDQPRVDMGLLRALAEAPLDAARPVVATRQVDGTARNPVRIEPAAADLVAAAGGDRGLGPLIDTHPGRVRWIEAPGANPDLDRPADLVELAAADWAERVVRNRDQVERLREEPEDVDHYAPVATMFRDDPRRTGDEILDRLLAIARRHDTWLDVGAGGGRYAFPLALRVRRVIALDPSEAMVAALRAGATAEGLANVEVVEGRWPAAAPLLGRMPCADAALIANVGHDIETIVPFLDALERAASRECVAIMQEQPPAAAAAPFFEQVHGERRFPLPALPDLLDLLAARGAEPSVELFERPSSAWSRDELLTLLRRQTWVRRGSDKDRALVTTVDEVLAGSPDGRLPGAGPGRVGVVRWPTGGQSGSRPGRPHR